MTLKFTLSDPAIFRDMLSAVDVLIGAVEISAKFSGLTIRTMDEIRVAMVKISLGSAFFAEYECPTDMSILVDLENLGNILKRIKPGDALHIEASEPKGRNLSITLTDGRRRRIFRCVGEVTRFVRDCLSDPKVDYKASLKLSINDLLTLIDDMMIAKEAQRNMGVRFTISPDSPLKLRTTDDTYDVTSEVKLDIEMPEIQGGSTALYAPYYLKDILESFKKLTEMVTLRFAENMPLELSFTVKDGAGHVKYWLAPRREPE